VSWLRHRTKAAEGPLALTARQVVGSAASERLLGESLEEVLGHTCATLLLSKNVNPKIVSEMLGHATIAIALDTYSHVLPNMQDSAAKAMEDALS
jgi:integrase